MTPAEVLRTVIVLIIFTSCGGWVTSLRLHWAVWRREDPRALVVSCAILPILILNGIGIVIAATNDRPVTWLTFAFLVAYAFLNVAMWVPIRRNPDIPQRRAADRLH